MGKLKKRVNTVSTLVYSTHKETQTAIESSFPPGQQNLRVRLEKNHRGGKKVSLIVGFKGKESDLKDLAKQIKLHCGTGGAVKNGEAMIQGDHADKIVAWLKSKGYKNTKRSGG